MSQLFTAKQVKSLFPKRDTDSNKGDFGRITLVGGCTQYSGAIRLAEMAASAMRSGVGLCRVAAPKSLEPVLLPAILESTFEPLSDMDGHLLFNEVEFDGLMKKSDVIAFGMGIGKTEETKRALAYLMSNYEGILIVDADGINCMAEMQKKPLRNHKCKLVLTPHPKEFSRLSHVEIEKVLADPEYNVNHLASYLSAVVLLKGHRTHISDGTKCYHVEKGGPGMATAGSGDVLAGIMAAVLACNEESLLEGAAAAAFINGRAGEIAEKEYGDVGQIASDTARSVAKAIQEIRQGGKSLTIVTLLLIVLGIVIGGAYGFSGLPPLEAETAIVETQEEDYQVDMSFVSKDIYIDGVLVNNYQLYRPFESYEGHIYVPLTEDVCSALGIKAIWEIYDGDLYIEKTTPSGEGAFYHLQGWDLAPLTGLAKANMILHICEGDTEEILETTAKDIISINDGDVLYIPISLLTQSEVLSISTFYEDYTGLYISTDAEKPAEGYFSQNNYDFIMGRAEYISSICKSVDIGEGSYYEYIFRHEANTREIDEDLILAVARTESSFYRFAGSEAGARGIMQIMPQTAKAYGIDPEELYSVHPSVRFGARYIGDAIVNFKGDLIKALSSYNFGGNAVLAGAYDTGYANTVLSRMEAMKTSIAQKGYSNTFLTKVEYHN